MRYTIAAPADSTVATAASCSARSRSSGPGTMTVRSACSRKWSIGCGQHLRHRRDDVVRRITGEQACGPVWRSRRGRPRPVRAPPSAGRRPGPGCSRTAQRGRRQIIARDASVGVDACARRQVGQHVEQQPPVQRRGGREQRIRQRRIGFAVGAAVADQARAGPAGPATSTPAGATWTAVGDSTNRSAATVGAQYGPDAVGRLGFRQPDRDQSGGRGHLEDQAEPALRRCR